MSLKSGKFSMINTVNGVNACMKGITPTFKKIVKAGYNYASNTDGTKEGLPYLLIKYTNALMKDITFALIMLGVCNYALCKNEQKAGPLIKEALGENGFLRDLVSIRAKKGLFGRTIYEVNSTHLKTHFKSGGSFGKLLDIIFEKVNFNSLGLQEESGYYKNQLLKKFETKAGRMTNWIMNGPYIFATIWGIMEKMGMKLEGVTKPEDVEKAMRNNDADDNLEKEGRELEFVVEDKPNAHVFEIKNDKDFESVPKDVTSVKIAEGVEAISNDAFRGCKQLTSIEIPNSVTTIGASAFDGCECLTSITIPESVKTISTFAFRGCKKLTSIKILGSGTTIGDFAFSGCEGLKSKGARVKVASDDMREKILGREKLK